MASAFLKRLFIFENCSKQVKIILPGAEERQEYLRFAREISKDRSSRYNYIAPDLDKYASEHRGFRISRVAVFPR